MNSILNPADIVGGSHQGTTSPLLEVPHETPTVEAIGIHTRHRFGIHKTPPSITRKVSTRFFNDVIPVEVNYDFNQFTHRS